jgi:uncharacterized protein
MVARVDDNRTTVEQLCREHHVKRLELFGSAVGGNFDPVQSDLDFAVEFKPLTPAARAASYFDLLEALQDLFQRHIDLVELDAIDNPYFMRSLEANRQVLYAS